MTNCTSSGTVSGTDYVGGVVGKDYEGTVTNCTSTGTVSGTDYVGGVVGQTSGTVTNCTSTGKVNGTGNTVGGVVGDYMPGTITNCGWLWSGYEGVGFNGDEEYVSHVVSFDETNIDNIAVTFTVDPRSITVTKGGTGTVSVTKSPHATGVSTTVADSSIAAAAAADGAITVTGVDYGTTKMTVDATFYQTEFPAVYTGEYTVSTVGVPVSTDVMITVSGDEPTPTPTPSGSGSSSGGCSAGFGALALLAALPLIFRQRRRGR